MWEARVTTPHKGLDGQAMQIKTEAVQGLAIEDETLPTAEALQVAIDQSFPMNTLRTSQQQRCIRLHSLPLPSPSLALPSPRPLIPIPYLSVQEQHGVPIKWLLAPLFVSRLQEIQQAPSPTPAHQQATLAYSCVCSNGISPNLTQYSLTIPYFECITFVTQCVNNCPQGDGACQSACTSDNPCGAQNPTRVNLTTTSTTMSATPTGTGTLAATGTDNVYTGFGGQPTTTAATGGSGTPSSASQLALGLGQAYGLGAVLFGVAAGFTIFL
ncbi:MAG: hypothetical protein MMC33_002375 [Icmadophila ericetorum]|nr:hypothetical protein [Icmadophila ericetorum]